MWPALQIRVLCIKQSSIQRNNLSDSVVKNTFQLHRFIIKPNVIIIKKQDIPGVMNLTFKRESFQKRLSKILRVRDFQNGGSTLLSMTDKEGEITFPVAFARFTLRLKMGFSKFFQIILSLISPLFSLSSLSLFF